MGQHYVPRVYLYNFAFNPHKPPKKRSVHCYDKKVDRIFIRSIADIAQEIDYNSIGNDNSYEDFYADHVEPELGKSLANINISCKLSTKNSNVIDERTKASLAKMITYQLLRTKSTRNYLKKRLFSKKDNFVNENENLFKKIILSTVTNSEYVNELSKLMEGMLWSVYVNCTARPFITSDNPVVLHGVIEQSLGLGNLSLAQNDTMIMFPLSPKHVLLLLHRPFVFTQGFITIENKMVFIEQEEIVDTINKLQIRQCARQIYSNEKITCEYVDKIK